MPDVQFHPLGTEDAPADWELPQSLEIIPKCIRAVFDGSGAGSAFLPCLVIVSDSGREVGRFPVADADVVAAGASAEVTWFPGARVGNGGAAGVGAWATCYFDNSLGDAYETIPDSVLTSVPFAHYFTTDTSVFTTKPNGTTGDTSLLFLKAGAYQFTLAAQWRDTFAAAGNFVGLNTATWHGPSWDYPGNTFPSTGPLGIFGSATYLTSDVYMFTDADIGFTPTTDAQAYQDSGVPRDLSQMWMRVSYTPTSGTATQVY